MRKEDSLVRDVLCARASPEYDSSRAPGEVLLDLRDGIPGQEPAAARKEQGCGVYQEYVG